MDDEQRIAIPFCQEVASKVKCRARPDLPGTSQVSICLVIYKILDLIGFYSYVILYRGSVVFISGRCRRYNRERS